MTNTNIVLPFLAGFTHTSLLETSPIRKLTVWYELDYTVTLKLWEKYTYRGMLPYHPYPWVSEAERRLPIYAQNQLAPRIWGYHNNWWVIWKYESAPTPGDCEISFPQTLEDLFNLSKILEDFTEQVAEYRQAQDRR